MPALPLPARSELVLNMGLWLFARMDILRLGHCARIRAMTHKTITHDKDHSSSLPNITTLAKQNHVYAQIELQRFIDPLDILEVSLNRGLIMRYHRGWLASRYEKSYDELHPDLPMSGGFLLDMASLYDPSIPPDKPRYPLSYVNRNNGNHSDREEDAFARYQLQRYCEQDDSLLLFRWQREYTPEILSYEGNLAPTDWKETARYPSNQSLFKFIFDDIVQCEVLHKGRKMTLIILLEHVCISSTGVHDETHLRQINAARIPFYWLFTRLYQGVSVNQYFELKNNLVILEGARSSGDGVLVHRVTYQFDLAENECTYKLYYRDDRLD